MSRKSSVLPLLAILTVVYGVGFVGTQAILSAIGFWYIIVAKPVWSLPNWTLVPLWLILHGLIGWSTWTVWQSEVESNRARTWPSVFVGSVVVVGSIWAALLFQAHRLLPALIAAALMWPLAVATTVRFWRIRPLAGRAFLAVVVWATYSLAFTTAVWRLNR